MRKIFFIVFISIFIFSCKKKSTTVTDPHIDFVSISPSSAVEYVNSISITISYDDADGDLGENNANVSNLWVTDSRNNVQYSYRISQLAPDNANIHIRGNLNIVIKNTAITDNSSSQQVTYSISLKHRAGNSRNTVTTTAITVTK